MRRLLILAGALALAACDLQLPGLTALDQDLTIARTVIAVHCDPDTAAVGVPGACIALNPDSATIARNGQPAVRWRTSDPSVVQIDLGGRWVGTRAGMAVLTAIGDAESSASDTVTITGEG